MATILFVIVIILSVLGIWGALTKRNYVCLFCIIPISILAPLGAYIISEESLGEKIVDERQDKVIPASDTLYFETVTRTYVYAEPTSESSCRAELGEGSIVYAYAWCGDWLRVKTIEIHDSKSQRETIGWLNRHAVKEKSDYRISVVTDIIGGIYSIGDFLLDCLQVLLAVVAIRLFRCSQPRAALLVGIPFIGISVWHFIDLFIEYNQAHVIADPESFNILLFYFLGWLVALAITYCITGAFIKVFSTR